MEAATDIAVAAVEVDTCTAVLGIVAMGKYYTHIFHKIFYRLAEKGLVFSINRRLFITFTQIIAKLYQNIDKNIIIYILV